MSLRVDPAARGIELVLPQGVAAAKGLNFLDSRRGWVLAQLARMPDIVPFADGAVIPILGVDHILRAVGPSRGKVPPFEIRDGIIAVTGDEAHLARRTRQGLATAARNHLNAKTATLASTIGRKGLKITVGDARSRWGSCAASGNIRYSWRLILAPEPVMDYVVAHEVAHLVEMNHGPGFWRLVERLFPNYEPRRAWLKRHGAKLLRYG